ncbi:MAG: CoA-acylating methylmalonate-semialdehyde dehydrogenase [Legionellaceae bacterium]|nr:CoA-acylating methylmalonate-semialdehyde dehydrogenase [Legionellaceae bacterium]
MPYDVPHFIGGELCLEPQENNKTLYNPATGEVIGKVDFASDATCNRAVSLAHDAFEKWALTTPIKRAQILFKFRTLLENNIEDIAKIVTREHGKTIDDAKGSIARGIELVEHHCGLTMQMEGHFSSNISSQIDCHTIRQPLGVCAGVSPFNFPVMVPIWMMIPAIATGNTFILKPSEQAPSAPLRLLELLHEAGLPDGVANIVNGDKRTVDCLLAHPDISAFTAIASTPVAESIYKTAIANGKRSHTFGGAKNHCVIMPDADFEQASNAIVGAAFGSAGERCMAISVVVAVGDKTADRLLDKLIPATKKIKIDAGDVPTAEMGPLVSAVHRERVLSAVNSGVAEGAELLVDGRSFVHPQHKEGYFLGPCLFDNVTKDMSIYQQEIFGPVLVVLRVATLDDAIALVSENQFGNGTAIFTNDGYSARHYSQNVSVGMVGINIPIPVPITNHPFGGWKNSAFGDYKMHGMESINFYTKAKTITSKWPRHSMDENAFVMPLNG